ncbi:acyl-homoserine-lactone synthase [Hoeflea sp.]|uniref:acyl-homoserine-lactone synthase n=1 Tax=Hoeflea sp. TaxID=1940281 RepID=UPI003B524F24
MSVVKLRTEKTMIITVESVDRDQHPKLIDEMYRMRAEVFSGRLGWNVTVSDGREIDRFDDENPLYLLSLDEASGELRGAVRLLPTTGPNMLRDVFPLLMPGGTIESPLIWESSRFAVNPGILADRERRDANHIVNRVTVELLCGIVEVCQAAGMEHVVSVFDARMARIFRSIECRFETIGRPVRIDKSMTYAGLFEISDEMRARLGIAGAFPSPVLASAKPATACRGLVAVVVD